MPKYEYACKSCGEHIEVVQSFADDPLTECPACGGQLRKVFQPVGIAFKGSGFYKTDSRSSSSKSSSSSSGESTKSDSKSETSKSDSSSSSSTTKADTSSSSSSSSTPAAAS